MLGPGWNHQPVFVLSHVVTALWQWPKWILTRWPWNRVFLGMFTCPMLGYFGWMQSLLYQTHEHDLIKPMIWIPRGARKMLFWMRPGRFTNGRLVIPSWGDKFALELALFSIDFLYICLWLFQKKCHQMQVCHVFLKRVHPSTWPNGHWSSSLCVVSRYVESYESAHSSHGAHSQIAERLKLQPPLRVWAAQTTPWKVHITTWVHTCILGACSRLEVCKEMIHISTFGIHQKLIEEFEETWPCNTRDFQIASNSLL
jgi:hypothetical protein